MPDDFLLPIPSNPGLCGLAADRSQHSATASRLAELRELILWTDAPSQRSDPDVK